MILKHDEENSYHFLDHFLTEVPNASLSYNPVLLAVLSQEECANKEEEVEETIQSSIQLETEYDGFEEEVPREVQNARQNACASDEELSQGELKHCPLSM